MLQSRFGVLMIAARTTRCGCAARYDTLLLKLAIWCLSALIATLAGMLYVPQVGIINPRLLAPDLSLEIAVWSRLAGRPSDRGGDRGGAGQRAEILVVRGRTRAMALHPVGLDRAGGFVFQMGWSISPGSSFHRPLISRRVSSETPELR